MTRARTSSTTPAIDGTSPRKPWNAKTKRVMRERALAFDALLVVANTDPEEGLPNDRDAAPDFLKGLKLCRAHGFLDDHTRITANGREAYKQARLEDLPVQRIRSDLTHDWVWGRNGGRTNECRACHLGTRYKVLEGSASPVQVYLVDGEWTPTCPPCPKAQTPGSTPAAEPPAAPRPKRELADVLLEISARVLVDVANLPLTRANAFDMIADAKNVGRLLRGTADRARAGIADFTREATNAEAIAAGMEKQYGEARKVIVAAWRSAAAAMREEHPS